MQHDVLQGARMAVGEDEPVSAPPLGVSGGEVHGLFDTTESRTRGVAEKSVGVFVKLCSGTDRNQGDADRA